MYDSTCGAAASGQCGPAQRDGDAPPPREPPPLPPADYSGFDIVKATQYGAIARVKELVEAGADVNRPDRETVTLLHWAAINNRRELVDYLLERGARVDAVGGELQATPLQWAARQGHLEAVVALVRAGADPALRDAEGCASLHLAAQFGHTAVVAYLVARGVAPDAPDAAGMTALMWACWKVAAVDPARLLLTLGASTAPADTAHGNTALHWAVLARNATAVSTLLLYGSASLDAANLRGVTALGMLQAAGAGGAAWLPARVRELVRARSLPARARYVPARLARDPAVRRAAVVALPFLAFYLTGLTLEAAAPYALKALLLLALYAALHALAGALLDDELRNVLPLSVYLATKAWFYITWAAFVAPAVPAPATVGYLAASLLLWWGFLRSWRADPGVIRASRADRLRTIRELAEAGGAAAFEPARFCSACLVRRPLRSKHCAVCNRCVARFDHHCPWVNNCIGERNHRHFLAFLGALLLMCAWTLWGCARYLAAACGAPLGWPACGAWVTWVALNAAFHLFWVLVLTCCQLYLVVCLGMTTNEQLNRGRYRHFQARGGRSPFSRGPLRNATDFFRCRLCGLLPAPRPASDAADADDAPMLPHHFV